MQKIKLNVVTSSNPLEMSFTSVVSPTVDVERTEDGAEIIVHDVRGTHSVEIYDGYSPIVTVTDISGGHRVEITDADGTHTYDVMNGDPGPKGDTGATGPRGIQGETGPKGDPGIQGPAGVDGYSPTVTVTDITGGHRVSITDAEGTQTFDVMDGDVAEAPVQDVQVNGVSVLGAGGVANIVKATDAQVKAGAETGKILVPSVQDASAFYGLSKAAGVDMSSSSNPVGTYTDAAKSAISQMLNAPVSVSGTTPAITGLAGVRYICGEVATLSIVAPESGCIDVTFISGATATVLTVTSAKANTSIKWANGFDPTALDANTTYEVNVLDGEYGVVGAWT